jgi:small-conductance mechanosensitive channel
MITEFILLTVALFAKVTLRRMINAKILMIPMGQISNATIQNYEIIFKHLRLLHLRLKRVNLTSEEMNYPKTKH